MTDTTIRALEQFSKMIDPLSPDEFIERYYEQRPLYIHRDKSYYDDLLTTGDIERFFQNTAIAKSVVRMNKQGREVHPDQFSERATEGVSVDRLSNDRILKLFEDGTTIIINAANRLFPNLDRYCSELERQLLFRVQPNIYVTPFSAQGFATHFDDHDVFILQIMGTKNWRLYHSPVELPSKRQSFQSGTTYALQAPQMEVTLSPGDTLYIPRGVLHDARTDGVTSAHITLGLHPPCRFDLLAELTQMAMDLPAFRKAIPLGLLHDREAATREFRHVLTDLIDKVDIDELIERRHKAFVRYRRLDLPDRFRVLAQMNRFNLDTIVRRRTGVLYVVDRDAQKLTVSFGDTKIPIQPFLESALDTILGDAPFAVRDVKGFLSDKARLDLAGMFVKAGFLEIVDWNSVE